jgi:ABC-type sugar transport system ATPase subunit
VLELKNIYKSFTANKQVLNNINLEIQDSEFLVLVGPSGCGKSTLIRIIAGLEQPDSGAIIFDGKDLTTLAPKDRNLSMVFQNYALYPHKTVFENIAFPLQIANHKKQDSEVVVKNIAEKLNIADLLERKPGQLSGGQRQRVALARALAKQPSIFLLDEPLSNLDAKLRMQMRQELFKLHKELNSTFIYVTHDQVEAMTLGDRIVVLHEGIIQQVGTPQEVYNKPTNSFVASFIGSPPANLLITCDSSKQLALRPEYLYLDHNYDSKIEVEIFNMEILGSEILLYGSILQSDHKFQESQKLIAKLDNNEYSQSVYREFRSKTKANFGISQRINLYFDKNLLYCF